MAAQRVHAAAGDADIAEQQLHHRHGADVLRADRMLRPTEREQAGQRLVRGGAGDQRADCRYLSCGVPQMRDTISGV